MTENLLPCPFCGGEGCIQEHVFVGYTSTFGVVCLDCCAETRQFFNTKDEAVAAWNRRVDSRQLALKTRVRPMCEDCPDGCPIETPKDSRNIVTNADRIRSMSDEELARFLWEQNGGNRYWKSVEKYLDWLQQPAKE